MTSDLLPKVNKSFEKVLVKGVLQILLAPELDQITAMTSSRVFN